MSHSWIFEVLTDLKDYALAHELPVLAERIDHLIEVAEAEIAAAEDRKPPGSGFKH